MVSVAQPAAPRSAVRVAVKRAGDRMWGSVSLSNGALCSQR
jgi:hypothetical protein